jgi:hypothetical protein
LQQTLMVSGCVLPACGSCELVNIHYNCAAVASQSKGCPEHGVPTHNAPKPLTSKLKS